MLTSTLSMLRLMVAALLSVMALQVAPAAAQSGDIDIEVFYRELEPYGRWVEHPRYGEVWAPDVEDDWRPYTRGQWVHTDEHGWYWESEEPFGWAVYHYGRWFRDEDYGWVWVPGTEWGPAWVAWRYNDEDVGWAPLPPEAEWRGDSFAYSGDYESPRFSAAWCFVPIAVLAAPRIWTRIAPPRRNRYFIDRTRFAHGYRHGHRGIYNGGFDAGRWSRLTGRDLPSRRIVTVGRPHDERFRRRRDEIPVYRPRVTGVPPKAGLWSGRGHDRPDGGPRTWRRPQHDGSTIPRPPRVGDRPDGGPGIWRAPDHDGRTVAPRPPRSGDRPDGGPQVYPGPGLGNDGHRGRPGGYGHRDRGPSPPPVVIPAPSPRHPPRDLTGPRFEPSPHTRAAPPPRAVRPPAANGGPGVGRPSPPPTRGGTQGGGFGGGGGKTPTEQFSN